MGSVNVGDIVRGFADLVSMLSGDGPRTVRLPMMVFDQIREKLGYDPIGSFAVGNTLFLRDTPGPRVDATESKHARAIRRFHELANWVAGMRMEMELQPGRPGEPWSAQRVYLTRELFDLCWGAVPFGTGGNHFLLDGLRVEAVPRHEMTGEAGATRADADVREAMRHLREAGETIHGWPQESVGAAAGGRLGAGYVDPLAPLNASRDTVQQYLERILVELVRQRRNGQ